MNKRIRIRTFAAAVVAVCAGIAVTVGQAESGPTRNAAAGWTWDGGLPGSRDLQLSPRGQEAVRAAATISTGINPFDVRRVVAAGVGERRLTMIAAANTRGTPCITIVAGGGSREYACLEASRFGDSAIVRFVADGGSSLETIDWVTIVGAVRSDVARLSVVTRSNNEVELSLNRSRGFGYGATSSREFPLSLRAYAADGSLIEELPTFG